MTTVTQIINVTARHIAAGKTAEALSCPIALAICDQVAGHDQPVVSCGVVMLGSIISDLPEEAMQFVVDFDNGRPVEPFAFALTVPVTDPE